jgi:acyl-CoA thioesterase-1
MSILEKRCAVRGARGAVVSATIMLLILVASACGSSSSSSDNAAAAVERSSGAGAAGNPSNPAPRISDRRKILFVGTSITAGLGLDPDSAYPQLIGRKLDSLRLPYDAVNAGVSGETSSGLLRRIDWVLREPFDVIVVETGANDGLRGTPVATVRANVQQIIDRIKAARPTSAILLVQMEALPNFGEQYTSQFRAMFPELARRNGIQLLPFLLEDVAGHRELNQPDGIHPNMVGERIVAENLWRAIRPILEQRLQARPLSSGS